MRCYFITVIIEWSRANATSPCLRRNQNKTGFSYQPKMSAFVGKNIRKSSTLGLYRVPGPDVFALSGPGPEILFFHYPEPNPDPNFSFFQDPDPKKMVNFDSGPGRVQKSEIILFNNMNKKPWINISAENTHTSSLKIWHFLVLVCYHPNVFVANSWCFLLEIVKHYSLELCKRFFVVLRKIILKNATLRLWHTLPANVFRNISSYCAF